MIRKWKKIKTDKTIHFGKFYQIDKDRIKTPGNDDGTYYVIRRPRRSVLIIPIDSKGSIYMTRQHRYPVNDFTLEFPSGYIDKHESEINAVNRELEEETGLISRHIEKIGKIYMAAGMSDIGISIFVAENVKKTIHKSSDPIDKNLHRTEKYSIDEIKNKIRHGEIMQSQTIAAFNIFELNYLKK